jgi:capsid protein
MMPGMAIDELNAGESIQHVGGEGTDTNFPEFESTIVSSVAWCLETPPEILLMSFNKNYSASQAALHEYRMTLNSKRSDWGVEFCQPIYDQFLLLQVLAAKVSAPGFIDAWSDPSSWDIYAAWVRADWFGTIKPSADILKTVKAYQALIDGGFITYAQATRELTGKKWRVVIATLKKERELYLEVFGQAEQGVQPGQGTGQSATLLKLVQTFKDDVADAVADRNVEAG